jgi:hypothetical protein
MMAPGGVPTVTSPQGGAPTVITSPGSGPHTTAPAAPAKGDKPGH